MARGAKLPLFDLMFFDFSGDDHNLAHGIGNGLWEPCAEAGCELQSKSWGADYGCELGPVDLLYDEFMQQVRRPAVFVLLVSPELSECGEIRMYQLRETALFYMRPTTLRNTREASTRSYSVGMPLFHERAASKFSLLFWQDDAGPSFRFTSFSLVFSI